MAPHQKSNILHIGLIILWLIFTCASFAFFLMDRLQDFDPKGILANANQENLASALSAYIPKNSQKNGVVIHFFKRGCGCNQASANHVERLKELANENHFSALDVAVNSALFVPSTPAVAILNKSGSLIYFGPYGGGLGCSNTNGFAETIFNNLVQGYAANLIVKDAKGCYCAS